MVQTALVPNVIIERPPRFILKLNGTILNRQLACVINNFGGAAIMMLIKQSTASVAPVRPCADVL